MEEIPVSETPDQTPDDEKLDALDVITETTPLDYDEAIQMEDDNAEH